MIFFYLSICGQNRGGKGPVFFRGQNWEVKLVYISFTIRFVAKSEEEIFYFSGCSQIYRAKGIPPFIFFEI